MPIHQHHTAIPSINTDTFRIYAPKWLYTKRICDPVLGSDLGLHLSFRNYAVYPGLPHDSPTVSLGFSCSRLSKVGSFSFASKSEWVKLEPFWTFFLWCTCVWPLCIVGTGEKLCRHLRSPELRAQVNAAQLKGMSEGFCAWSQLSGVKGRRFGVKWRGISQFW